MSTATATSATTAAPINTITVEVIGSALSSIVEEMGEALVRASYSTNIKERRDSSTALFDMDGTTLCQAEHIPMHLGSFIEMIPCIMQRYPADTLSPGDVFIGNDAYVGGGTHLPDIVLAEPIFVDGKPAMWAVNTAHHSDFLDRGHDHIFQEGIRIPPIRLYKAGELVQDVEDLILLNCQLPHERLPDFRAQLAANRMGVQRVQTLCAKYGLETVLHAGKALQDYADRKMRAGIELIPDGTYTFADTFDSPGSRGESLPFSTEITVKADEMHLHFESPAQLRAAMNMNYTSLLATVYYAVKSVIDPTILPNAGLSRALTVTAPKGTILHCVAPAAVDGRIGPAQRVVDLIHGALIQAVPERVTAAGNGGVPAVQFLGQGVDGRMWGYNETIGGGSGARYDKDGLDGVHVHMTNTSNLPVEALEIEYPITLLKYELVQDSGGTGEFRGGMSIRRVYRVEEDCHGRMDITRVLSRPFGVSGGGEGTSASIDATGVEFDGEYGFFKAGTIIEVRTAGAGGYGDPSKRPPEQVARDVEDGRISLGIARSVYGWAG
ncbi:hydantoinase B/oxoprolinase family protein [Psychromarinibacter sp. S121]|uniref:hydantoinase B/oxoprolinase family protein n=1 Tax=Psychromarinibacter sp. S121 TaxID=3415127 RepID=UPI003C79CEFC